MKGCNDYGANIQLYLDKELTGQDLEEFHAHVEECSACRLELEAEEELSGLLHRSRPLYSAPDALRKRVIRAAQLFPSAATHAPVRLRKRIAKVLTRPLQSATRPSWPALIAAILLVAVGLLVAPGILRQSRANSYIETAIAAHRSFLSGSLPLEVQSESPGVVTAWFAGKVPLNFRLPNSAEESGHEQVYRLVGGRLVNYKGEYAALVAYQVQQQKISLLVSSNRSAVAAGGEEVPSGGIVFHYSKKASFNVITWSIHGLTYALVSSLPGSGRESCLVCHQNMANSGHFSAHR
ncbi:zf-HC2 domain-containing protein [Edaphobacter aggregans]|uniref:zf-HC2 domain-containing protein n=1 Tax=Edaphobacter aggregans TaxID=570835 RepID=UPI000551A3EC|nr:zf-HC2 domain-containing protein [Edaphobacter aggregans]